MALVYFDASALLKLCVPEPDSPLASALWNRADVVVTSRLADTEVRAALAAGVRGGHLDAVDHTAARRTWESLWPALHVVEVTPQVAARAGELLAASPHPLRSGDALHVASALALRHDDTVVAAWDEHVAAAARAQSLRVVP